MEDKLIKGRSGGKDEKTLNFISIAGLCFIFLTAGFMVWQNVDLLDRLTEKEIVATAFAEGIQSMCEDDNISEKYSRICVIAKNYSEESEYLDQNITSPPHVEIERIECEDKHTVLIYSDGTETITNTRCETRSK